MSFVNFISNCSSFC